MQIVSAQWNTLVERLREEGNFTNCLAICDVSGSMGSLYVPKGSKAGLKQTSHVSPIFPAVALSLLVSQLASPPFSNSFITFSESPEVVTLSSTASFVELVQEMENIQYRARTAKTSTRDSKWKEGAYFSDRDTAVD